MNPSDRSVPSLLSVQTQAGKVETSPVPGFVLVSRCTAAWTLSPPRPGFLSGSWGLLSAPSWRGVEVSQRSAANSTTVSDRREGTSASCRKT